MSKQQLNDIRTLVLKRSHVFQCLTQLSYHLVVWMSCLIIVRSRGMVSLLGQLIIMTINYSTNTDKMEKI